MARLIWTEPAIVDLQEIAEYIALANPVAAARLAKAVLDAVMRLEKYPESGRVPPELPNGPYREIVLPPCRIFYRTDTDDVYVLHIMRSERLLRSYLLERAEDEATRPD